MRYIDRSQVMFADEVRARFNVELLPCPFCGARENIGLYMGNMRHVTCVQCYADGPIPDKSVTFPEMMAIQLWNERGEREQPYRDQRRRR